MESPILKIGIPFFPKSGRTYSICMRGARRWDSRVPLQIFTNGNGDLIDQPFKVDPTCEAVIVSQQHFAFFDLCDEDCSNNYDPSVDTLETLLSAMVKIYPDFDTREIITLLTFKIQ